MSYEKEIYDNEYKKANELKKSLSKNSKDWKLCNEEELQINDIIYVEYYPDSQKYIYTHSPEYGIIKEIRTDEYYSPIENINKMEISIIILNQNNKLVKINKEHFSIYSRGYLMSIEKYEPINNNIIH
jgi:pyruvate carboxylase